MQKIILLVVLVLSCVVNVYADPVNETEQDSKEFDIKDPSLTEISAEALKAIKAGGRKQETCKYIGKKVDLDTDGEAADLFVTTKDACEWGATIGPIIVLRSTGQGYKLVLDYVGFTLRLEQSTRNGLRNISIIHVTAGHQEEALFVYDGSVYRLKKEIYKDLTTE